MQGNKEQNEAIVFHRGPAMILAGPGSGKTFVVVERVRHLIEVCKEDPAGILVILSSLDTNEDSLLPTCDKPLHQAWRSIESRGAFRGIKYAYAAACTSAYVEEPSAGSQTLVDAINSKADVSKLLLNSVGDLLILIIDDLEHLHGRKCVYPVRKRIPALRLLTCHFNSPVVVVFLPHIGD